MCAGNSLGGVIGAALASERPEVLDRLVMLDPPVIPDAPTRSALGLPLAEGTPDIAQQARRRRRNWPSREAAALSWRRKPVFENWVDFIFERYLAFGLRDDGNGVTLACDPEVEATIFERTGSIDLFARAGRITIPTNIVRASRGRFAPEIYETLAAKMPLGRTSVMEGGHLLPMEVPAGVADLLLREARDSYEAATAGP